MDKHTHQALLADIRSAADDLATADNFASKTLYREAIYRLTDAIAKQNAIIAALLGETS
jgi:hypothetical protein